jgi:hypothetical protein
VKGQGNENAEDFQTKTEGKSGEELYLRVVGSHSVRRFYIREEMFQQKQADWNNARQRMEPAPQERRSGARSQGRNPLGQGGTC